MTSDHQFTGISVLIPGYSVEDIPTDLNEAKATGLLNAIACAWHPAVLAAANGTPQFKYADISDIADSGQILLLPECSEEWLGHDWEEQLQAGNCTLLHGLTERSDWLTEIERRFGNTDQSTPTILVEEFWRWDCRGIWSWRSVVECITTSIRMKHGCLHLFATRQRQLCRAN